MSAMFSLAPGAAFPGNRLGATVTAKAVVAAEPMNLRREHVLFFVLFIGFPML